MLCWWQRPRSSKDVRTRRAVWDLQLWLREHERWELSSGGKATPTWGVGGRRLSRAICERNGWISGADGSGILGAVKEIKLVTVLITRGRRLRPSHPQTIFDDILFKERDPTRIIKLSFVDLSKCRKHPNCQYQLFITYNQNTHVHSYYQNTHWHQVLYIYERGE